MRGLELTVTLTREKSAMTTFSRALTWSVGLLIGLSGVAGAQEQSKDEASSKAKIASEDDDDNEAKVAGQEGDGATDSDAKMVLAERSLAKFQREFVLSVAKSGSLFAIVRFKAIQKELGLTDKQVKDFAQRYERFGVSFDRACNEITTLGKENEKRTAQGLPSTIESDLEEFHARLAAVKANGEQSVRSVLTDKQVARLEQIAIQARGPLAVVTDEEVMQWIGLRPDQQIRAARVLEAMDRRQKAIREEGRKLREAHAEEIERLQKEREKEKTNEPMNPNEPWKRSGVPKEYWTKRTQLEYKSEGVEEEAAKAVWKILSGPQKASYRKLVGRPFDFSSLADGNGVDETKVRAWKKAKQASEAAKTGEAATEQPR